MYDVFHMLLLKQDIQKKKQINQNNANTLLKPKKEFEARNNKKYEVKSIVNNAVYSKKVKNQLSSLYYLILQKNYSKEKNI